MSNKNEIKESVLVSASLLSKRLGTLAGGAFFWTLITLIAYLLCKFFLWEIGFELTQRMYEILLTLIIFFAGYGCGLSLAKLVVDKTEKQRLEGKQ